MSKRFKRKIKIIPKYKGISHCIQVNVTNENSDYITFTVFIDATPDVIRGGDYCFNALVLPPQWEFDRHIYKEEKLLPALATGFQTADPKWITIDAPNFFAFHAAKLVRFYLRLFQDKFS